MLILQDIGSEFLAPIALEHLQANPIIEGDLYEGDLLNSVCSLNDEFWAEHPQDFAKLRDAIRLALKLHHFKKVHLVPRVVEAIRSRLQDPHTEAPFTKRHRSSRT